MLRETVERRLIEDYTDGNHLFPAYDNYCFANLPETVLSVLDNSFEQQLPDDVFNGVATDVDNVVVFLLDGFGLQLWKRHWQDIPFLRRLTTHGTVTPLTSVYPSETAAAMTTFYTGLEPAEHGLLGWYQYLESVGENVVTLPFTTIDGEPLSTVAPETDARELFTGEALSARASAAGIDVQALFPATYADSGYSKAVTTGAERTGYDTAADLAHLIRRTLETASGPTAVYAYEPTLDSIAHEEGTGTERYRANLVSIASCLHRELLERLDPELTRRTLVVLTADHGIVDTVPEENVDLPGQQWWAAFEKTLTRDGDNPRLPTGSPRNVQFHVQPDDLETARGQLKEEIDGRVWTRDEARERELFGTAAPSALFERRVGDLIAVGRDSGLCWHTRDRRMVGMHGGLTREEMLVPLAIGRLDALRGQ